MNKDYPRVISSPQACIHFKEPAKKVRASSSISNCERTTAALTSPRPSTKPTDVEPFAYKDEHHQTTCLRSQYGTKYTHDDIPLRPSSKYERTQVDAGFALGGCEEFGAEFELKCCELYAKFGFGLGGWEESKAAFGLRHCEASSVKFGLGCCEECRKRNLQYLQTSHACIKSDEPAQTTRISGVTSAERADDAGYARRTSLYRVDPVESQLTIRRHVRTSSKQYCERGGRQRVK